LLVHAYNADKWNATMLSENLDRNKPVDRQAINNKKMAINGHADHTGCHAWVNSFASLGQSGNYHKMSVSNNDTGDITTAPDLTNNCQLPTAMVYDPANKKAGVRCSIADHAVAIFGKTDGGRAKSTTDNVGVQYGLKALLAHTITAEDFVTLNEVIGGLDGDGQFVATRSVADSDALATAYRAGLVGDGKLLAQTAIIDLRGHDEGLATGPNGIHHAWRSFALRARLDAANSNHDNLVLWRFGTGLTPTAASGLALLSFTTMDQWLTDVKADTGDTVLVAKLASHKPKAAVDFCYLSTDLTFMNKITDAAICDADRFLQPHKSPRQIAGGPLAENILKCQLKPFNMADYGDVTLTTDQVERLKKVFPDGVCDWSKAGVGQQAAVSPLDFSAGPGGVPLSDPPDTKGP
jgi:hypothetical protein